MARKTYGQYCGLAKALDHVGDRWTLLIIRELLVGPRRYSSVRAALPGIATNLLADRLDTLEADGLVTRSDDGLYWLTEEGGELEPAIHALVRWGGRWMGVRDDNDVFRPQWLVVALRSLLPKRRSGSIEVHVNGEVVHIDRSNVGLGPLTKPDAVIEDLPEKVLAVASGRAPASTLKIRGDRKLAAKVIAGR
jgi:DNA-binding HxlR family transcriptional regulator